MHMWSFDFVSIDRGCRLASFAMLLTLVGCDQSIQNDPYIAEKFELVRSNLEAIGNEMRASSIHAVYSAGTVGAVYIVDEKGSERRVDSEGSSKLLRRLLDEAQISGARTIEDALAYELYSVREDDKQYLIEFWQSSKQPVARTCGSDIISERNGQCTRPLADRWWVFFDWHTTE